MQLECVYEDLVIHHHLSHVKAILEFARQVRNGIRRLRSHVPTTGSDMFCY